MLHTTIFKIYFSYSTICYFIIVYILINVGDIAWIARTLQNMKYSIFGPMPTRLFNLDDSAFDVVDDNNNNNPTNNEISVVAQKKK